METQCLQETSFSLKHSLLQDQEVGKKPETDKKNKCEIL